MARTLRPFSLTTTTTSNTPNHHADYTTNYLTDIYYLKNAALSAIRKVINHLNTQEKNVINQRKNSKTDLTAVSTDILSNISPSMREQTTIMNLI